MTAQSDFFTDVAALQRRQQFRMRRLQVYNWGTFSDLHDIVIADKGFLFVGRSGSGKSTLLDAMAALLVPPQWLVFNAAAREGERSRRDRNLVSYIRGAWGDQKDIDSGEITSQFLRRGTTWSALALTFVNGEGRHVTLVQLYWLRGASAANTDVRRHYMIAERSFDIAGELDDFDLDVRTLKHRLADVEHFGNTFRPYGERFRRFVNIESEMALKLLHKTQSAKNLGDLNEFLRQFMLDEPESFAATDRLVAEFAELDTAHQAVVTARRQVETLIPAREAYERLQTVEQEIRDHDLQLAGIDGYCDGVRVELLAQKIEEFATRDEGLAGEETRKREDLARRKDALATLEAEHRQNGGDRIEELERRKSDAEMQRDERLKHRSQVEASCRTLEWSVPDNAHLFSEQLGEARGIVEAWRSSQDDVDVRRDTLRDRKQKAEAEFTEVRREIEAMRRHPSNIPAHMLDLRRELAAALGCSEAELPFIGELIQVKADAAQWRGAIERLLHGFALSLLVDERRYAAVSGYVDETHLGGRLIYYRVAGDSQSVAISPGGQSLLHKLELKETSYRGWLASELARRFDYVCVENLRDFRQAMRAITIRGQIRHGPDRHEKDDRTAIDDQRRWVLGFDNREKLALYMRRAQELGDAISELERLLAAFKKERDRQQERVQACMAIINLSWQGIDVASILATIQSIDRQLGELREGSHLLKDLGERIERQRRQVEDADQDLRQVQVARQQLANDLKDSRQAQQDIRQRLPGLVQPEPKHREMLEDRFRSRGALTLRNLDERRREVERGITKALECQRDERSTCVKKIENAFAGFKREWPQDGADVDATVEAARDFLALLQRLERDGLPRHEQRFFDMLKEQSTENLAALNAHLSQARKEIHARMELVNEGLADAEFNPGTHLQIAVTDRHLPEVRAFREHVGRVLSHAWQMDRAGAEERFLILRELVQQLDGQESEQRRWRELVLDVRLHMEFIGRELDEQGNEVEIYRSGAGKSGGQREKLSTTCLAAALRYQLGGADGGMPLYAPVVLDEAFGKADNEFTELAMRIFERFGFQMIVATPLKSVMTLEPFIGGACFVDIADRKRSATLPIEYDAQNQRLDLPTYANGEVISASS